MLILILLLPFLAPPDGPVEWLQPLTVTLEDTFVDQPVTYTFRFRNETDAPVVIDNVRVGCGCTATEWEEQPVAPGQEGQLTVTFDADTAGFYRKYVKVFFRGHRGAHKLWIEGFVENEP
ncbi:DUF1573 domain-containing protein [Neolewinella litorea]|uniref:DUF1573 domain-containing protein n=1 Tax=Neolewinella litorea TaxID=2562452 RepID=A0A4S4NN38_9BACT|nr:DUF1573 domain-containing protein [Neolewinella litorea]THH41376.1 DUF1573 domain-containing protein [Neolewinella litorea]